jgi:hypoxanthine phosphoribosyltransferase
MTEKIISWCDLESLIVNSSIKDKYNNVDLVVSIGSGGMTPGVIISKMLNKRVVNIGVKSYAIGDKQTFKAEWYQDFKFKKSLHKKILIVDDINDTGYTFHSVNCHLMSQYFTENDVFFLSMYMKPHTTFTADYLQMVNNDTWLKFPWEVAQ